MFEGLGPKRRESCNGDWVYFVSMCYVPYVFVTVVGCFIWLLFVFLSGRAKHISTRVRTVFRQPFRQPPIAVIARRLHGQFSKFQNSGALICLTFLLDASMVCSPVWGPATLIIIIIIIIMSVVAIIMMEVCADLEK